MIKIFHVSNGNEGCGDDEGDLGEVEGFMNEKGEIIGSWSMNDGHWRGEYFNGMFKTLGVDIQQGTIEQDTAFVAHMKKEYGL